MRDWFAAGTEGPSRGPDRFPQPPLGGGRPPGSGRYSRDDERDGGSGTRRRSSTGGDGR
jgi:hypothetical protein